MSAPLLPVGSLFRCIATFIYGGAECQYKMHLRSEVIFPDMLQVCSYFENRVVIERLMTQMVGAVELFNVECALIGAEIFTSQTLFPHDDTYGAIPELGAMPIVANVIQLRTGASGRSGRGRMFLFGFPNSYVENQSVLSHYGHIQIRNLADALENEVGANGEHPFFTAGVFSRKLYHQTGDASTSFFPVSIINTKRRLTSCSKRRS